MNNSTCESSAARRNPSDPSQLQKDDNEPARLLVVDDVEDNRVILARRLARRGFLATEAESGRRALDLIASAPFDVVLLDVMMPEMDGLEVLQRIRQTLSADALPVVMCTAKSATADIVQALKAGANDYVTKPIDFDVALARVNLQVEHKRANTKLAEAITTLNAINEQLKRELLRRQQNERSVNRGSAVASSTHSDERRHVDSVRLLGNRRCPHPFLFSLRTTPRFPSSYAHARTLARPWRSHFGRFCYIWRR